MIFLLLVSLSRWTWLSLEEFVVVLDPLSFVAIITKEDVRGKVVFVDRILISLLLECCSHLGRSSSMELVRAHVTIYMTIVPLMINATVLLI